VFGARTVIVVANQRGVPGIWQESLGDALYHYVEVNDTLTERASQKLVQLADVRFSTAHALRKKGLPLGTCAVQRKLRLRGQPRVCWCSHPPTRPCVVVVLLCS